MNGLNRAINRMVIGAINRLIIGAIQRQGFRNKLLFYMAL
jgi:hypothetical protein